MLQGLYGVRAPQAGAGNHVGCYGSAAEHISRMRMRSLPSYAAYETRWWQTGGCRHPSSRWQQSVGNAVNDKEQPRRAIPCNARVTNHCAATRAASHRLTWYVGSMTPLIMAALVPKTPAVARGALVWAAIARAALEGLKWA